MQDDRSDFDVNAEIVFTLQVNDRTYRTVLLVAFLL